MCLWTVALDIILLDGEWNPILIRIKYYSPHQGIESLSTTCYHVRGGDIYALSKAAEAF